MKQAGEDDSLPPEDSSDSEEGTSLAFNELLLAEKSRYVEDFIEVCCLGKGGYGRVFKVYCAWLMVAHETTQFRLKTS